MYSKSLASIFLLATSAVADYSITQPVDGTVWKSGAKITITWLVNDSPPATPAKFDLTLMSGPAEGLQTKTVIASGISTSAGKYEWTVPADIANGQNYVVRAGNGGDVKYSHFFNVAGSNAPSASSVPMGNTTQASSSPSSAKASSTSLASTASQSSKSNATPSFATSTNLSLSKASTSPASSNTASTLSPSPAKSNGSTKTPSSTDHLTISAMVVAIPVALLAHLQY